jgi:hypothetical protein
MKNPATTYKNDEEKPKFFSSVLNSLGKSKKASEV